CYRSGHPGGHPTETQPKPYRKARTMYDQLTYNSPAYHRTAARVNFLEVTASMGVPLSVAEVLELARERARLATCVVVAFKVPKQDDADREGAIAALRVQGSLA